ncbi:MAG: DUF488 family protein [Bacteroidota bacterium]
MIKLKRVYEKPERTDGKRLLVDRLWPRGLRKEDARINEWLKEFAPSDSLRQWYGHKEEQWQEFRQRYRAELKKPEASELLLKLRQEGKRQTVTLLFGAKDEERNNAVVLKDFLEKG